MIFEVLLPLLTQSRAANTPTASKAGSRVTPTPAPIPGHSPDSVDFGLVAVRNGELSCDRGLIN